MTEESPQRITIGDTTYAIARFRGLKASIAGALISRTMRQVPQLQDQVAKFRKEYRTKNTIVVTPGMAKMPKFSWIGLSPEDFAAGNGVVELPEEPDGSTILVNMFPELFDLAQQELQRFLALIVIPNSELEAADDADEVDEALTKLGKRLIRNGDLDELLELVVIGTEVFREQMAAKRDRLGKLPIPALQRWLNPPPEEKEEIEEAEELPTESSGPGESSPTQTETSPSPSQSSVPPSSDDSPSNSDGTDEQLSMESLGTS